MSLSWVEEVEVVQDRGEAVEVLVVSSTALVSA
jgi:hypothetical protein